MHPVIATLIVILALITYGCYYFNNKVVDYKESFNKPQGKCVEQAIIDETADAAVVVDVVEAVDSAVIKVVKHQEVEAEQQKKTKPRKYTRKSQNNAKLRSK